MCALDNKSDDNPASEYKQEQAQVQSLDLDWSLNHIISGLLAKTIFYCILAQDNIGAKLRGRTHFSCT